MEVGVKVILFDLGNTLEDQNQNKLLPGAVDTLRAIAAMVDSEQQSPVLALASDFGEFPATPEQIRSSEQEYDAILDDLGITEFFTPSRERVTLSAQVGAFKPDQNIFEAAVAKIDVALTLQDALFITERKSHVTAARALGMSAVHFKGPGEATGDIERLVDLIPIVQEFVGGGGIADDL
jgi:FMN phosphatase YigB (HAD superfamily)